MPAAILKMSVPISESGSIRRRLSVSPSLPLSFSLYLYLNFSLSQLATHFAAAAKKAEEILHKREKEQQEELSIVRSQLQRLRLASTDQQLVLATEKQMLLTELRRTKEAAAVAAAAAAAAASDEGGGQGEGKENVEEGQQQQQHKHSGLVRYILKQFQALRDDTTTREHLVREETEAVREELKRTRQLALDADTQSNTLIQKLQRKLKIVRHGNGKGASEQSTRGSGGDLEEPQRVRANHPGQRGREVSCRQLTSAIAVCAKGVAAKG